MLLFDALRDAALQRPPDGTAMLLERVYMPSGQTVPTVNGRFVRALNYPFLFLVRHPVRIPERMQPALW